MEWSIPTCSNQYSNNIRYDRHQTYCLCMKCKTSSDICYDIAYPEEEWQGTQRMLGGVWRYSIYFLDFIYLFLERGEGREKQWERNINVRERHELIPRLSALTFASKWGPNLQPRHDLFLCKGCPGTQYSSSCELLFSSALMTCVWFFKLLKYVSQILGMGYGEYISVVMSSYCKAGI